MPINIARVLSSALPYAQQALMAKRQREQEAIDEQKKWDWWKKQQDYEQQLALEKEGLKTQQQGQSNNFITNLIGQATQGVPQFNAYEKVQRPELPGFTQVPQTSFTTPKMQELPSFVTEQTRRPMTEQEMLAGFTDPRGLKADNELRSILGSRLKGFEALRQKQQENQFKAQEEEAKYKQRTTEIDRGYQIIADPKIPYAKKQQEIQKLNLGQGDIGDLKRELEDKNTSYVVSVEDRGGEKHYVSYKVIGGKRSSEGSSLGVVGEKDKRLNLSPQQRMGVISNREIIKSYRSGGATENEYNKAAAEIKGWSQAVPEVSETIDKIHNASTKDKEQKKRVYRAIVKKKYEDGKVNGAEMELFKAHFYLTFNENL